jgi:signal transduction histidine kinase
MAWAGGGHQVDTALSVPPIALPDSGVFRGQYLRLFAEAKPQADWQLAVASAQLVEWRPGVVLDPERAYWLKLKFYNPTRASYQWLLTFDDRWHINLVDFYQLPVGGSECHLRAGTYRPTRELTNPQDRFRTQLTVAPGDTLYLWARIANITNYSVVPTFVVQELRAGLAQEHDQQLVELAFLMAFLVMALYNAGLFFTHRRVVYVWYVAYLLAMAGFFAYQEFYFFDYFFGNIPVFTLYGYTPLEGAIFITYAFFVREFYRLPTQLPKVNWANNWIIYLALVKVGASLAILAIWFDVYWSDLVLASTSLVQLALMCYLLWHLRQVRERASQIVWWGIVVLIVLTFVQTGKAALIIAQVLPGPFDNQTYLIQAGAIFEIVCFSLALGLKAKQHEVDKQEAQAEIIQLKQTQNERLEQQVEKRTRDLQEAYEALKQHKEELTALNENLEYLIQKRTAELTHALDELTTKKNGLEEFSYITSHNLRGPIAQLLGLTSIFNAQNPADPFNLEVIARLQQSAQQLDEVIHDLNRVLVFGDEAAGQAPVLLSDLVTSVLASLDHDIVSSGTSISLDFAEVDLVVTIKDYLASVIYHLVSNAIKYRSDVRPPHVWVRAARAGEEVCLEVRDNGLGIDMSRVNHYKIFGMYQRLHTHTEGKGLGLYLAKAQVEALHGRIELDSKLGSGSTFKIYLPAHV